MRFTRANAIFTRANAIFTRANAIRPYFTRANAIFTRANAIRPYFTRANAIRPYNKPIHHASFGEAANPTQCKRVVLGFGITTFRR